MNYDVCDYRTTKHEHNNTDSRTENAEIAQRLWLFAFSNILSKWHCHHSCIYIYTLLSDVCLCCIEPTNKGVMAFTFGGGGGGGAPAPAPSGGFSFGGAAPATAAPAAAGGGFSFGGGSTDPAGGAPSFNFGSAPPPAAEASGRDNVSNKKPMFGGAASAAPTPAAAAGGFGFGAASTTPAPAGGFGFGSTPAVAAATPAAPAAGGFSFGSSSAPAPAAAASGSGGGFAFGSNTPAPAAPGDDKNAPAPSFGFGSTPAPAPTTSTSTTAKKEKRAEPSAAPAADGGFSFGGSTPAPSTDAAAATKPPSFSLSAAPAAPAAAAGGGFAFGSTTPATPTATTTPGNATTPGAPAPVMTPQVKPPGVTTPGATPTTAFVPTTNTPAATTATAVQEPPALEYQSLTVEQILNTFQKELEQDSIAFLEQAKRVCEYDAVVRDSQRDLVEIANQTQRLLLEQEQIENSLMSIHAFQKSLEHTLEDVSTDIDVLFTSQSHLAPQDADVERERAYQLSQTINQRLEELELNLGGTVETLSNQAKTMSGGSNNSMLTILNQHQNAIGALEGAAHRLETDVTHVGRMLAAPSRSG